MFIQDDCEFRFPIF